ncbi:MAG TPA: FAD/NAD(P)-binding protein [Candidatus Limnocylindria bacterium]|nr:FAD/NAD(P)-binding protein [Candidatus Limnocylindria bacterium]
MRPLHHLLPQPARVERVEHESADTRTFVLRLVRLVSDLDRAAPGQFVMLSLLGTGEAPFTFSQLPATGAAPGTVVLTVRRMGAVTRALFALAPGATVGVRGPFGRGFPLDRMDEPCVYVAGGCGLTPLRAAIDLQLARRAPGTPVGVLYGARDPATRIHRAALDAWRRLPAVRIVECLQEAPADWSGARGLVTAHVAPLVEATGARRAALCGPAGMLAPAAMGLRRAGIAAEDIHVVLERHMKCGYGTCGHCYLNHRYVCTDGPVFSLAELDALPDAFDSPADTWHQACP